MGFLTRFRGKLITKKKKATDVVCVNYRISTNFDEPRSSLANAVKQPATRIVISKPSPPRNLTEFIPKLTPEAKSLPGELNNRKTRETRETGRPEKEHEYEPVDDTSTKSTLIFMTETHNLDKKSIQDESEFLQSSIRNEMYDRTGNENQTITAATTKNVRFKNRESVIEDTYYDATSTSSNEPHYNPPEVELEVEEEEEEENYNNTVDDNIGNTKTQIKETQSEKQDEKTFSLLNNNNNDDEENREEDIISTAIANTIIPETASETQEEENPVYFLESNEGEVDDFKVNIMQHNKDETDEEDDFEESYTRFNGTTFSNYASNIFFGEDDDTISQGSTASA